VDGYSHHNHQKRDLGISKKVKGMVNSCKGNGKAKDGSKGGLTKENTIVNVICVHIYLIHVICEYQQFVFWLKINHVQEKSDTCV
jgi:hypothetical protein